MRFYGLLTTACLLMLAAGCSGVKSARGFSLPEGDPTRGQAAFVELRCHACHTVSGVDLPELDPKPERPIALGGEVARLKTYGELVTSIINPSHRIAKGYPTEAVEIEGQSKMTNYNEILKVSQLIDLVAFLEAHYKLEPYEPTDYPMFP